MAQTATTTTTSIATVTTEIQKIHRKRSLLFEAQAAYLQVDPGLAANIHAAAPDTEPVILRGSRCMRTTVGRGHDATVQIGRSNKRVSREHVVIEHKPQFDGFELTILSPNGALIDRIVFVAGEHVPLIEGTTIEILGTRLIFLGPTEDSGVEDKTEKEEQIPPTVQQQSKPRQEPVIIKETKPFDLMDSIVRILACSRKTSMTVREIVDRLKMVPADEVLAVVTDALFIGRIERTGKTADGSPKEDLFYYQAEKDPIHDRRKQYSQVGRGARKCTMKDTQYFFRIPPKLPNHRGKSYVPPPAPANKKRRTMPHHAEDNMEEDEEDEEDFRSSSSGGVSDQEVGELFQDV